MTSPRGRLTAVTVACVVFGPAAMVAAWRSPESDGFTVLATAAGWPWAWAALEGGLVWRIQTKVMTTLFALFAEVERDLIRGAHPRGPRPGQGLGPEARPAEGLARRLPLRWQGRRDPALPRAGRVQDRHREAHRRVAGRPCTAS